jgi:hypothetical protein
VGDAVQGVGGVYVASEQLFVSIVVKCGNGGSHLIVSLGSIAGSNRPHCQLIFQSALTGHPPLIQDMYIVPRIHKKSAKACGSDQGHSEKLAATIQIIGSQSQLEFE